MTPLWKFLTSSSLIVPCISLASRLLSVTLIGYLHSSISNTVYFPWQSRDWRVRELNWMGWRWNSKKNALKSSAYYTVMLQGPLHELMSHRQLPISRGLGKWRNEIYLHGERSMYTIMHRGQAWEWQKSRKKGREEEKGKGDSEVLLQLHVVGWKAKVSEILQSR